MGKSVKERLDDSFTLSVLVGEFNSTENSHVGQPTLKKKKKKKKMLKKYEGRRVKIFLLYFFFNKRKKKNRKG